MEKKCEKCGRNLNLEKTTSLNYDTRVCAYTDKEIEAQYLGGKFLFGTDCARMMVLQHKRRSELLKNHLPFDRVNVARGCQQ